MNQQNRILSSFEFHLFLLTLFLSGIILFVSQQFPELITDHAIWAAQAFFVLLTWSLYRLSLLGLKSSNRTFTYVVMGSMFMRLFFSIFFIVIYLIINDERSKFFIVGFMFMYILYSLLEIIHLAIKLRSENKEV